MNTNNETAAAVIVPVFGTLLLPNTTIQLRNLSQDDVDRIRDESFIAGLVQAEHTKDHWSAAETPR